MKNLLAKLKHLPSSIAGVAAIGSVVLMDPRVQAAATLDPHVAAVIAKATAITAGLGMIFGVGPKL